MISFHLKLTCDLLDILIACIAALPASMQYITCINLSFSHLLTIRVYPVSHFQLFLTCCFCQYLFVTHFLFSFRYTASHCISKTTDVNRVTDFSFPPFFKCPRVRPCECGCIHEDTLYILSRVPSGAI
jgi:hypothetical protein